MFRAASWEGLEELATKWLLNSSSGVAMSSVHTSQHGLSPAVDSQRSRPRELRSNWRGFCAPTRADAEDLLLAGALYSELNGVLARESPSKPTATGRLRIPYSSVSSQ